MYSYKLCGSRMEPALVSQEGKSVQVESGNNWMAS
jgi:hypothetical protein